MSEDIFKIGKNSFRIIWPDKKFKIHKQAVVNGTSWYTVGCAVEVAEWVRQQDKTLFYEYMAHTDQSYQISLNQFDIHEQLYSILALRWA